MRLRGTKAAGAERTIAVAPFAKDFLSFALAHGDGQDGLLVRPWENARRDLEKRAPRSALPG